MSIKKRHPIRSSDIDEIIDRLKPKLGEEIETLIEGRIEKAELDGGETVILKDEKPILVKKDQKFIPLLSAAEKLSLKRVTVDMGAVGPISNGADIMAPGIVEVNEDIKSGEIIGIEDEKNKRIIAVGTAIEDGTSLEGESGKVVENIHHVGDRFWDIKEEF